MGDAIVVRGYGVAAGKLVNKRCIGSIAKYFVGGVILHHNDKDVFVAASIAVIMRSCTRCTGTAYEDHGDENGRPSDYAQNTSHVSSLLEMTEESLPGR